MTSPRGQPSQPRGISPSRAPRLLALLVVFATGCAAQRPGERWVKSITLSGNSSLRRVLLLRGLSTQETRFWFWAKREWFDSAALDTDIRRIETTYAAHGFFEARVTDHKVIPSSDGRYVRLWLRIREGPPSRIAAVEVVGADELSPSQRAELARDLGLAPGRRFSYRAYRQAKNTLRARLVALGRAYARVSGEVLVDRRRHSVRVRLRCTPGPLVRLGTTRFVGHDPIPEEKLQHLLAYAPYERYDAEKIEKTKARLFKLRVFSSVNVELPREPTDLAPVTIRVWPAKLRELRLGGGVGFETKRHEVRLQTRWTWFNFLGGLRTLEVRLRPAFVVIPTFWDSQRTGVGVLSDVKLTQPDIFGTRISVFGLVGYDLGVHEGYRFHGPRAQAGLDRSFFDERLRLGGSWNLQFLDFFDIVEQAFDPSKTALGLGFKDPYRPAWLEQFAQLDLRDSALDPRLGFYAETRLEQGFAAIASDFTYFKVTPEVRGYVPLGTRRLVLAARALLGYLAPRSDADSPITRRFTLGGPTSHRGFSYGRLSPQGIGADESRVPLGGNGALLLSADLRLRLVRIFNYWLGVGAFFDAGDVTPRFSELSFERLHLATGGGLQFETPIGSVRFAIGVRLNRLEQAAAGEPDNPDPGERLAFHLTIGEAF